MLMMFNSKFSLFFRLFIFSFTDICFFFKRKLNFVRINVLITAKNFCLFPLSYLYSIFSIFTP